MFTAPITTNIVTTDIKRARAFYAETLGLKVTADHGEALQLDAGGAPVLVYQRPTPPKADHTVATWDVQDIVGAVTSLRKKGVKFELYEGYGQDKDGIASRGPDGPKMAWFKDPDGNTLGLLQPGTA